MNLPSNLHALIASSQDARAERLAAEPDFDPDNWLDPRNLFADTPLSEQEKEQIKCLMKTTKKIS